MIYDSITELIGNTPLLRIDPGVHQLRHIDLWAKLECCNPFGSLKDRIALAMLDGELERASAEGRTVLESSSGNTAKALGVLASVAGVPCKTVTNRIKVPEVRQMLQLIGVEIEELPGLSECPDPGDPNDPLSFIEQMIAREPDRYLHTSQYTTERNPASHRDTTGPELQADLGRVDYLVGGVGTAGSTIGAARYLREHNPPFQLIGVVADKGDVIPGIRTRDELYEVGIFDRDAYDALEVVTSREAIEEMLTLIRRVGVLAGPTSGASLRGALRYLRAQDGHLSERRNAVVLVCDRVEPYMSYVQKRRPDLFQLPERDGGPEALTAEDLAPTPEVAVETAPGWISEHRPLIIDLRGPLGFRTSHIAGSLNIVDSQFGDIVEMGVPFSRGVTVLLVCPVGDASRRFAAYLRRQGADAYSLAGGILAWRDAGLPLERAAAA